MTSRSPRLAALALGALVAATLAGCLEARDGTRNGQTDTLGGDTTGADTTVVDLCQSKVCDDGDPCTIDSCDPTTGECIATSSTYTGGAMEPPECYDDGECDDGDPCTQDVCRTTEDECSRYYWAYCDNVPITGCGGCTLETCDDNDPCTSDVCVGDTCTHAPIIGCGEGCSGVNAVDAAEIEWTAWPGDAVTVAGVAMPYTQNVDPVCYTYTPQRDGDADVCQSCEYPVGMASTVYSNPSVRVLPSPVDSTPWRCMTDCGTTCSPMLATGAYWAWGTARSSWSTTYMDPPEEQAVARPPTDGLEIQGWCLQTNAQGLPGHYEGELLLDGYTRPFPFEADILPVDDGGIEISLTPAECTAPECPTWIHEVLGTQYAEVEPGDGSVSFGFEMIGVCNRGPTIPVRADLVSYHNTLSGAFYQSWQTFAQGAPQEDIAYCSSGTLSLTKVY